MGNYSIINYCIYKVLLTLKGRNKYGKFFVESTSCNPDKENERYAMRTCMCARVCYYGSNL